MRLTFSGNKIMPGGNGSEKTEQGEEERESGLLLYVGGPGKISLINDI